MWEAATGGVLWKKVFLKTWENSQKNACTGVAFLRKMDRWPAVLSKKTPFVEHRGKKTSYECFYGVK